MNPRKMLTARKGYISIPLGEDLPEGYLIPPTKNWIYRPNGLLENFPGFSSAGANIGGTVSHLLGNGYAAIGLNETTDRGSGNVVLFQNYTLWFTATGTVRVLVPEVSGSLLTVAYPQAGALQYTTTIPQVIVRDVSTGLYKPPKQVGLSPQNVAPNLQVSSVVGTGYTGKMNGSYSHVLTALRTDTGDESLPSQPSPVVQVVNGTLYLTFPPARTDGCDAWRDYSTYRNFGSVGGYNWYKDYTESFVANSANWVAGQPDRTIEIEYLDNELKARTPPTDAFAPTGSGDFMFSLANIMCIVGTFGGLGVSISEPGAAGSYPPEFAQFTTERIIMAISRPDDNHAWLLGRNSIWAAVLTGATDIAPISVRSYIDNIGVGNSQAAVNAGGLLFLFTSGRQPAMIDENGRFTTDFAQPVKLDMVSWDETKVRLSYDERAHVVLFAHQRVIYAYHMDQEMWSPPIYLDDIITGSKPTGNIVSMFYLDGVTHVVCWNTTTNQYDIWLFDNGTNGSAWTLAFSWDNLDSPYMMKDVKAVRHSFGVQNTTTINGSIYKDGETTTPSGTYSFSALAGNRLSPWAQPNIPEVTQLGLVLAGSGYKHRFYNTVVEYILRGIKS